MRKSTIESQNRYLFEHQRQFRVAADIVTDAWMKFDEVAAVAVIGSVARPLWKEIPRFREFRRAGVEVWHECGDLDLALWLESLDHLETFRRVTARALRAAYEAGSNAGIVAEQLDVFLFEPGSDRYLGRLCHYGQCPKGKPSCLVPGCGAPAFNRRYLDFHLYADILEGAAMLYRRGTGRLGSALDLPPPGLE
jgi:hypothetical protein